QTGLFAQRSAMQLNTSMAQRRRIDGIPFGSGVGLDGSTQAFGAMAAGDKDAGQIAAKPERQRACARFD
ncbi:MAG: hypothetical protein FWD57_08890, partial [Polyangiaceae bacterium]|nr:hypothetical protein [Polyangiaceae bacterium]